MDTLYVHHYMVMYMCTYHYMVCTPLPLHSRGNGYSTSTGGVPLVSHGVQTPQDGYPRGSHPGYLPHKGGPPEHHIWVIILDISRSRIHCH